MPHPTIKPPGPSREICNRIGQVAVEWSCIELFLADMLSFFCQADPGSMYVITETTSSSSKIGWLRTLTDIKVNKPASAKIITDLLSEIDGARNERNVVVHGVWNATDDPLCGSVQTFRWDRAEVARTELWSTADLDDLVNELQDLQYRLSSLGQQLGFVQTSPQ